MKSLRYKLIGVFIILIFCLAPLGAIDLDNNTKYTNQDDNGEINASEDANITVDNETADMGNETEEKDNKIEIIVDEKNKDLNASLNSSWQYTPMYITVDDIYEGEGAFMEVHTADFINEGLWIGTGGNNNYVWMENGYACTTIYGLTAGTYIADYYNPVTFQRNETTFHVFAKTNPIQNFEVKDILCGQKAVAEVHTDKSYLNNLIFKLDDTATKSVKVSDGYASVGFDEDLTPGEHTVEVVSQGSREFKESKQTKTFTVDRKCDLDIHVDDVYVGDPIVVDLNTSKQYDSKIYCFMNFTPIFWGKPVDGHFIYTCSSENLTPGTYIAHGYIVGGNLFDNWWTEKEVNFKVMAKD